MKKDIHYRTIDGRGVHESFKECVTKVMKELNPGEGIHIIKDFEPFPIYQMMAAKGFDKFVEKISDTEYHAYFFPFQKMETIEMEKYLEVDLSKIRQMTAIKVDFLNGKINLKQAKEQVEASFDQVTAQEFAMGEQYLQQYGITDEKLAESMEDILKIFEEVLVGGELDLPLGHPIRTYLDETEAIDNVINQMEVLLTKKFIKNQWSECYEKLSEMTIHFSRKQNQLFAALERKGFDKPSKVMWTLDNQIKDKLKEAQTCLNENEEEVFIQLQVEIIEMIKDMMVKEREILFPTAMELLLEEDFIEMRRGDDEIGYCLIPTPMAYKSQSSKKGNLVPQKAGISSDKELLKDLAEVLSKHGVLDTVDNDKILDVSQGQLTLKQINLIFKHLQVDLSYVDEHEIVKFYSDTKHRVFPRSAGVIGRQVQNCHPKESVETVEKIIKAFRSGEKDEAEFWLEIGGKFIYIIYNAVRDEEGNFRGVLEMMQDVTHIRSLTGSQRLLSWEDAGDHEEELVIPKISNSAINERVNSLQEFNEKTLIGDIVKAYPFIKDYLINLSPKFSKLKNPLLFKTMSAMATIEMISERGGFDAKELMAKIGYEIELKNKKIIK